MNRALSIYLAFEVLVMCLYGWFLNIWLGWKPGGPYQFPGSPDATWLYSNALEMYYWAGGFLSGVWIGGIVCILFSRFALPRGVFTTLTKACAVLLIALPPAALIAGTTIEAHTLANWHISAPH